MPTHPALLALLCSAALVLGARPCLGASVVSLVSDPPPQPLSASQCVVDMPDESSVRTAVDSESRASTRGGACPLQWMPVLLASYTYDYTY
eukprot:scaffold27350_cov69-Phaeocystis_antarctica.AAC.1